MEQKPDIFDLKVTSTISLWTYDLQVMRIVKTNQSTLFTIERLLYSKFLMAWPLFMFLFFQQICKSWKKFLSIKKCPK